MAASPSWRRAWRALMRRPAFFAAAVLTLAFGTGTTTAVFSLVDTVLVKPLPYPGADRLVTVYESSPTARERTSLLAPVRIEDWHRLNHTFAAISGSYTESVTDTSAPEPERLNGVRVAPRFFAVYGVAPRAGRFFTAEEERAGGPGAAVISDAFWARRFERQPSAIGHALLIGGRHYPIVGVAPATFTAARTEVWLPSQTNDYMMRMRDARFFAGVGRLKPGATLAAALQDLNAVQSALGQEFPKTDGGWAAEVRSLKDARVGDSRRGLLLVLGAVTLLWVITVTNIAGLSLVQFRRRARELAMHTALGASRLQVIGCVVREGLVIAVAGAALGVVIAGWLLNVLPSILSSTPRINELTLDWRAAAFVGASSLLAAVVFSLVPALAATRARLSPLLVSVRGGVGGHHRLQRAIVVGQVALSVLLLASAMLLLRSYYNLTQVTLGFDPGGAITFNVAARWDEDRTRIGQLQDRLLAQLQDLHHVQAAGRTNFLPASGATLRYPVFVDGVRGPNEDGSMTAGARMISGGYLRAIQAQLVAGDICGEVPTESTQPLAAMVNQRFVEVFAPGQNLVGRTLRNQGAPFTIAGVVADIAEDGPAMAAVPYVYSCVRGGAWPDPSYVVRTTDARALTADLRRIVRELDPGRAIFGVQAIDDVIDASLDRPRFDAAMLMLFAGAALLLAAVGQYSLFMLVVSERTREVALRLAIGAEPRQVARLVMAGAGRLLAVGIVTGVALTIAADRVLRGALFGVSPADPAAIAVAVLALLAASGLAVAAPALRAARIAPAEALRGE
jgi:predicted permease